MTVIPRPTELEQVRDTRAFAPVFFMHIAKTAGSYLNSVFDGALEKGQLATHVEHRLGNTEDLERILQAGVQVISGHVMNGLWEDVSKPLGLSFRKITILREPVSHLASHLLWLDHYNQPHMRAEYSALDEPHQRIVDRIGSIDLEDIGQLDRYLTELGASELRLFDNCQSRYFIARGRRDLDASRPLSLADAREVRRAASTFDAILAQDNLESDVQRLGTLLELPLKAPGQRINVAKSKRRIDTKSPIVRQVLSKRLLLDQWLWRSAVVSQ